MGKDEDWSAVTRAYVEWQMAERKLEGWDHSRCIELRQKYMRLRKIYREDWGE